MSSGTPSLSRSPGWPPDDEDATAVEVAAEEEATECEEPDEGPEAGDDAAPDDDAEADSDEAADDDAADDDDAGDDAASDEDAAADDDAVADVDAADVEAVMVEVEAPDGAEDPVDDEAGLPEDPPAGAPGVHAPLSQCSSRAQLKSELHERRHSPPEATSFSRHCGWHAPPTRTQQAVTNAAEHARGRCIAREYAPRAHPPVAVHSFLGGTCTVGSASWNPNDKPGKAARGPERWNHKLIPDFNTLSATRGWAEVARDLDQVESGFRPMPRTSAF